MTNSDVTKPPLLNSRFVALLAVQFTYGIAFSTFYLLPRFLIEEQHAPAALVGNAHGAFALSGALVVPWLGSWIERVGARRTLTLGVALGVVTFFVTGYLKEPALVLALRALHGVSFAFVFTSGSVLAIESSPLERRAEAIGYFGTASLITNGFGPSLAEFVVRVANWTAVFWVCSAFAALALVPVAIVSRQRALPTSEGPRQEPSVRPPWNRALAACYLTFAAVGVGVGASKTFVPALMVSSGQREVSSYFIAFTLGALIQRTVFGRVPDRMGYARATLASLGLYACCMFAFFLLPVYCIPAVSFFLGISHGVAYPASAALSMSYAAANERGRVASWTTGFYNAGFALAGSGLVWLEPWLGYAGLVAAGGTLIAASGLYVARELRVFHRDLKARSRVALSGSAPL